MRLNKRGQSLVEFALILPILLLIFFAIMDGALIIQGLLTVNHAAREAARFAVTYQPTQGECYGSSGDPYPWCPAGNKEGDAEYYDRRVALIKEIAREKALGLRITTVCEGAEDSACLTSDEPGLFGARVWGYPSFDDDLTSDNPGLPGLPVRVGIVHNVPLIGYAMLSANPYFRVNAEVEMVNEGVQAGYQGAPPPVGGTLPPVAPPTDPPETVETPPTGDPTGDPGGSGVVNVELNFENALNRLPGEREHIVIATVTQDGVPIPNENVRFTTDNGSFALSGSETVQVQFALTDNDGKAEVAIYTNKPTVAKIEAWADVNDDNVKDDDEIDTATKTWQASGPYLVVSDHNPEAGDIIGTLMYNHEPGKNPHALWWCVSPTDPIATVAISKQLLNGIAVDDAMGFFDATNLEVPEDASGIYRMESHEAPGGCGQTTSLVATSADIIIKIPPPDLTITDVTIVAPEESERSPGGLITLTVEVKNLQPISVTTGPFDLDVYPHLEEAPYPLQLSASKQWIDNLGPEESTVLTFSVEAEVFGLNQLWAQVDATGYVIETDETNNVFGPVEFETDCVEPMDDFDDGLESFWSTREIGDADASHSINGNGELVITNRSSSGLWTGNHNFYYIYRPIPEGDRFDARLRLILEPDKNSWSKIGLHVREGLDRDEEYVMNMITHNRNPAGVQIGHNGSRVTSDRTTSLPYWARIVREGTRYDFYSTTVADPTKDDWQFEGSTTENTPLPYIGIAHANYNSSSSGTGIVDDFIMCPSDASAASSDTNPPGLVECEELITVPGFEGNIDTVFEYWRARDHRQTSEERYSGNFSVRLMASLSINPCTQNSLDPYLYQDVQIPTSVYSISDLVVTGHYLVKPSDFECSHGGTDEFDKLTLELQGTDNSVIVPAQEIANGSIAISHTTGSPGHEVVTWDWHKVPITLSQGINLENYAGDTVRLYWDAYHNDNFDGTFFYVDNVSAQVCTMWPIPEEEPGTVSLGGTLTTKAASSAIRVPLPGADVWAYTQSGEIYHTVSIHDGTYHFYNLAEPGIYIVYAEATVDGQLRTAVSTVTLTADQRNYNVNMLLQ